MRRLVLGFALCGLLGSGCGSGDGGAQPSDAAVEAEVDASAGGEPDACAVTHGQTCNPWNPSDLPEGGEIRIETRELAPYGAVAVNAAEVFLFYGQEPEHREILGIPLNDGRALDDGTICWNKRDLHTWGSGARAGNQTIYETRTYLDAGESVRLVPVDETPDELVLDKVVGEGGAGEFDVTSRAHGLDHPFLYRPAEHPLEDYGFDRGDDTRFELATDVLYEPIFPGSDDVPEFGVSDGWSVVDDRDLEELYLYVPSRFELSRPAEEDFVGDPEDADRPVVAIAKGADFVFELEGVQALEDLPEGAPGTTTFVSVEGDDGIDFHCLQAEPTSGTITLPAEVIDEVRELGTITVGQISHALWAYDGRYLHVVGATAKVGSYCLDDEGVEAGSEESCAPAGVD